MSEPTRSDIYAGIVETLKVSVVKTEAAAQFARETATAKENIAENKYDTLGIEAAYLAHGQSVRVEELKADLKTLTRLGAPMQVDQCAIGSIVLLQNESGARRCLLLAPCQGGLSVKVGQLTVQLVTTDAPVGKSLLGCAVGDDINIAGQPGYLEILGIS